MFFPLFETFLFTSIHDLVPDWQVHYEYKKFQVLAIVKTHNNIASAIFPELPSCIWYYPTRQGFGQYNITKLEQNTPVLLPSRIVG
jgi:hypothetical protein